MALYIVEKPYYRQGVIYNPGETVEIPDNEPVSDWMKKVVVKGAEVEEVEPEPRTPDLTPKHNGKGGRPNDRRL